MLIKAEGRVFTHEVLVFAGGVASSTPYLVVQKRQARVIDPRVTQDAVSAP